MFGDLYGVEKKEENKNRNKHFIFIFLIPSLPQSVKFPGWKMHGHASKWYIFRSFNTSTFNAMRFDENPLTCQCKKKERRKSLFQISHFYWLFSSSIMAVKGLRMQPCFFFSHYVETACCNPCQCWGCMAEWVLKKDDEAATTPLHDEMFISFQLAVTSSAYL